MLRSLVVESMLGRSCGPLPVFYVLPKALLRRQRHGTECTGAFLSPSALGDLKLLHSKEFSCILKVSVK